jgi:hypothetical protein
MSFSKFAFLCAVVALVALGMLYVQRKSANSEAEYLAFLHSVKASDLSEVEFYEADRLIETVTAPSKLEAFADAIHKTAKFEPNHPAYARSITAELKVIKGPVRQVKLQILERSDNTIYMDLYLKKDSKIVFRGYGKNTDLFRWLTQQGILVDAKRTAE